MAAIAIPANYAVDVLQDWLDEPETQRQLIDAISRGIACAEEDILNDPSWRVPRRRELRESSFRRWITPYQIRLSDSIADEVHNTFPFISHRHAGQAAQIAMKQMFPELQARFERVLEQQLQFAVRGIALKWTRGQISDGLALGMPERDASKWRVPLYRKDTQAQVAEVYLNDDGEILSDAATVRHKVASVL